MKTSPKKSAPLPDEAEPAWEIAYLFPPQGAWSEDEYLALETNRLVEFSRGRIEVLPMPTMSHQLLVRYLLELLGVFAAEHDLGTVLFAGLRVRLWAEQYREPDVVFMLHKHANRMGEEYWDGADLVMEVVSGGAEDRRRDLVTKREEYARAGIPEYWIVDPAEARFTVLRLIKRRYVVHGEFLAGMTALSRVLPGFEVNVTMAFARQTPAPPKPRRRPRNGKEDKE